MDRVSFSGLEVFTAIARHGSIRTAAQHLGLQPSTVSHRLKDLEARLGVPLFVRTTRSVNLTEAGRVLLRSAAPALDQLEDALQRTRLEGGTQSGALRLNAPYVGYKLAIAERLSAYQARYPQIAVEFSINDQFVDIVAGDFHAGIRFGGRIEADMVAVPLTGPVEARVIASPAYLSRHPAPAEPADLLAHRCIRYRFMTSGRIAEWHFQGPDAPFTVDVGAHLVTNSLLAIIDRVIEGDGLAHVPTALARPHVERGELVTVLDDYAYGYPALYLYFPRENRANEVLRTFVDFFRAGQ